MGQCFSTILELHVKGRQKVQLHVFHLICGVQFTAVSMLSVDVS